MLLNRSPRNVLHSGQEQRTSGEEAFQSFGRCAQCLVRTSDVHEDHHVAGSGLNLEGWIHVQDDIMVVGVVDMDGVVRRRGRALCGSLWLGSC